MKCIPNGKRNEIYGIGLEWAIGRSSHPYEGHLLFLGSFSLSPFEQEVCKNLSKGRDQCPKLWAMGARVISWERWLSKTHPSSITMFNLLCLKFIPMDSIYMILSSSITISSKWDLVSHVWVDMELLKVPILNGIVLETSLYLGSWLLWWDFFHLMHWMLVIFHFK
jgi:hypothetical protein